MSTTTISTSSSSSEDVAASAAAAAACGTDHTTQQGTTIKTQRIKIKSRSSSSCSTKSTNTTPDRLRLVETMLTSKPSLTNKLFRAVILFLLGSALAFVLNMLQMEYKANLFPNTVIFFFQHNWFFIPLCGMAAAYIGTCYSIIDKIFGQIQPANPDWTVIIRCLALFIGLNHLVAKIHFENASHFSMILITFCVVFWYWFDKTKSGLVFNILNAVCIIIAAHMVRYLGIFNYTNIQFDYLQTCLACFVFSGGVTFGNIGRILELYELSDLVKGKKDQQRHHEHSD